MIRDYLLIDRVVDVIVGINVGGQKNTDDHRHDAHSSRTSALLFYAVAA